VFLQDPDDMLFREAAAPHVLVLSMGPTNFKLDYPRGATPAVVDDHTRECLALIADTSLSDARVVRELDAVISLRG
jgi:hypothetical protein